MGKTIEAVKDFVYLGSNQSTNSGEEMELQRRILQANRMTHHEIWSNTSSNKEAAV
jgi:hypothetical protein